MRDVSHFDLAQNRFRTGLEEMDRQWGWYFALGVFLVALGTIASGMAVTTTLLSVALWGWTLLCAGAVLVIFSFFTGKWSGFLLTLAAGALSAMAGITTLSYPLSGAIAITIVVGTILIAAGIFRSLASVVMRFPNWGWSLVSGLVSLALGAMLLRGWQTTSLYFLGLYIGLDLILHGLSWIMFSLRVHNLARKVEARETYPRAA
jgi:uncharacterized membrane protein HdeD (DUF308 family)